MAALSIAGDGNLSIRGGHLYIIFHDNSFLIDNFLVDEYTASRDDEESENSA